MVMEKLYPMLIWISTLTMYATLFSAVILFPFFVFGPWETCMDCKIEYHLVEFKDNFELLLMEFLQNKYEIS